MAFRCRWRGRNISVLTDFAAAVPAFMREARVEVPKQTAEEFLKRLKSNWEGQVFALAPLSAAYLQAKARKNLDLRILVATKLLISKLEVFQEDNPAKWIAGIKTGTTSATGWDLAALARVLEYGSPSHNLKPRPIFHLTLAAAEHELKKIAFKVFRDLARARLAIR